MIFHTMNFIIFTRGHFGPQGIVIACVCIYHLLVRKITRHLLKLGKPNRAQRSKTPWLRSRLFWGAIDLNLNGQINYKLKFDPSRACPKRYSSPIEARISKFEPQMHLAL